MPFWAETVGWVSLGTAFASALVIAADEFLGGYRQSMAIMNFVHPITALYWGPVWVWAYFTKGRRGSTKVMMAKARRLASRLDDGEPPGPRPESDAAGRLTTWNVAEAVSHCGAGCTLGDIAGEWIVWGLGTWMLGATGTLGPEYIWDFPLAWAIGVLFQYFTIVPMRPEVAGIKGAWLAMRADTLSILSFQLGLFGWMAISHLLLWSSAPPIGSSVHWWMMQVGMAVGFFTAWPVNRWLVRVGWKEKMDPERHIGMMAEQLRGEGHAP